MYSIIRKRCFFRAGLGFGLIAKVTTILGCCRSVVITAFLFACHFAVGFISESIIIASDYADSQ